VTDDDADRTPVVRASDADREAVVARLHVALGEGRIDVDEFGQRAAAAYEAVRTAELDLLLADLPTAERPAPESVGSRSPEVLTSTFGDIKLAGTTAPQRAGTVFGDVRVDLRGLRTDADRVELWLSTVFGDVEVIVAEGVDAQLQGRTVFGDRKVDLAAVPRITGTPRIVVHARTIFGDLTLRSLGPGEHAGRWRALLDRLAGGGTQPR
jgi:hypothetical protein